MDKSPTDEQAEPIRQAIFHGNKIEAIKLYRAATGAGLAEAKEAIEQLQVALRASNPQDFKSTKSGGCLGVALIFALVTAGLLYSLLC